jgi:hypothetical protein
MLWVNIYMGRREEAMGWWSRFRTVRRDAAVQIEDVESLGQLLAQLSLQGCIVTGKVHALKQRFLFESVSELLDRIRWVLDMGAEEIVIECQALSAWLERKKR